jgi:ABC-type oligopeptide transport system ATPase subunit
MTMPLLQVRNLRKYFPILAGIFRHEVGVVKAVDGIDFTVHKGEVLGLVGESGCGKSTAARAAIRLIEPTAGEISFDGQNMLAMDPLQMRALRRQIQMVFQDPYASLNPRKTVAETIGEALVYHHVVNTDREKRERIAITLERVGLSPEAMNRYPHEFSGGQQQRICIARAVALEPMLIVCDEAVSALDVSVQAQILNLLIELKETMGLSYLFISHNLSVIRHISDKIAVMHYGRIVEQQETEALFAHPEHEYTRKLLAAELQPDPHVAKVEKIVL